MIPQTIIEIVDEILSKELEFQCEPEAARCDAQSLVACRSAADEAFEAMPYYVAMMQAP